MRPLVRLGLAAGGLLAAAGAGVLSARPRAPRDGDLPGRDDRPDRPVPVRRAGVLDRFEGERMDVVARDGTRLAVELFGPRGAPQVVLSHGWTNSGRVWQEVVRLTADRLRLVTWDQPGHGRSEEPRDRHYDLDVHGDALRAVVDGATGPGPLVLAGHSLGGMTVMALARRHPELVEQRVVGVLLLSTMSRVPIIVDGAARTVDRIAGASRWLLDHGGRPVLRQFSDATPGLARWLAHRVALASGADPSHVAATTRLLMEADPDVLAGLSLPILSLDEEDALGDIHVPTVVVCGEDDRLTPPGYSWHLARSIPQAELLLLPGIGHMTPLESAAIVADQLLRLAGVVLD